MDDVGVDLPEGLLDHIRGGRAAIVVGAGWGDAALGRLPVAAIWTVGPVEAVARAVADGAPDDWPERPVVSLFAAGAGARAARQAFADAPGLQARVAEIYRCGALVLVGFEADDPDLRVLLERILVGFPPPETDRHVFVGPAAPRAELLAEHGMTHVRAPAAEFLAALVRSCSHAGLTLAGQADRVDLLLARVELLPSGPARAAALVELAGVFEKEVGDPGRALTAIAAAVK